MNDYICYMCGTDGTEKEMAMVLGDVDAVCHECIDEAIADEE